MKTSVAVRRIARDIAADLVPMIKQAAQRGSTADMVRIGGALDAFRESSTDGPTDTDVLQWRIVRVFLQDRPLGAAERRRLIEVLGFSADNGYDDLVLVPQDFVVIDKGSLTAVVAHLALRAGVRGVERRTAEYLDTPEGKKLHAEMKRRIEASIRRRTQPTARPHFTIAMSPEEREPRKTLES